MGDQEESTHGTGCQNVGNRDGNDSDHTDYAGHENIRHQDESDFERQK